MNSNGEKHPHRIMADLAYKLIRDYRNVSFKYSEDQQKAINSIKNGDNSLDNVTDFYLRYFVDKGMSIGFFNSIVDNIEDGEGMVMTLLQLDQGKASRETPAYAMSSVGKSDRFADILISYIAGLNRIIYSVPDSYKLMDSMSDKDVDGWKQAWNESMSDFVSRVFKTDTEGIQILDGDTSQKLNAFKRYVRSPSIILGKNKLTKEIYLAGQAMSEAYRTLEYDDKYYETEEYFKNIYKTIEGVVLALRNVYFFSEDDDLTRWKDILSEHRLVNFRI